MIWLLSERKLNMPRHGDVDRDQRAALVKETLPARRSEILGGPGKNPQNITSLKKRFPFMFGAEELWKEMELLLSGQVGLREKFSEGLKT
ncbi:uncharacterized protein LOC122385676 isoform X2 [Amphibalanus amphitrite]|nr:uncharacterized protein LOC122385676 isoform X2 [Amphibalanus amphitrite]